MKFSQYFKLNKTQYELDFVNVYLEKDTKVFIDPWAIRQLGDDFSLECLESLVSFFDLLVKHIQAEDYINAKEHLRFAHEVREIRLGDAFEDYHGSGMNEQTNEIFEALKKSKAIKSGLLQDIEDCALMIDNINRDKISDMVANIIKLSLIKYTQSQCHLHEIEMKDFSSGYYWDVEEKEWTTSRVQLPAVVIEGREEPIVLVPKNIVRRSFILNYRDFYRNEILDFEMARYSHAAISLSKTLQKPITKRELKKKVPSTKSAVFQTALDNPTLLEEYKKRKAVKFIPLKNEDILDAQKEDEDLQNIIQEKITDLENIQPGKKDAYAYHKLIIGILEIIFYPQLSHPVPEFPLKEGMKKVDISFLNKASEGFFLDIIKRKISAQKVFFECKNYTDDPKNPEIDQLSGRLGNSTCEIGFLVCRTIEEEIQFLQAQGVIIEINFGDGKKRYEIAGLPHHHHVICTQCHKVEDVFIEKDLLHIEKKITKEKSFVVKSHSLEFFGICKVCL